MVGGGGGTGGATYIASVTAPTPVACTTVLSLLATAVPDGLVDEPLDELVDPGGGGGGVVDDGIGAGPDGDWVAEVLVSITGPLEAVPMAMHELAKVHDTPLRSITPEGTGSLVQGVLPVPGPERMTP